MNTFFIKSYYNWLNDNVMLTSETNKTKLVQLVKNKHLLSDT